MGYISTLLIEWNLYSELFKVVAISCLKLFLLFPDSYKRCHEWSKLKIGTYVSKYKKSQVHIKD